MDLEARLLNVLQQSTYHKPLIVLICLICHFLWTGNDQYTLDMLDLNMINSSTGLTV